MCPWNRRLETPACFEYFHFKNGFQYWDFMYHLSGTRACKTLRETSPCPKTCLTSKILLRVIPQPEKKEKWDHINHLLEIYANICFPFSWFTSQGRAFEFQVWTVPVCQREAEANTVRFNQFLSKSFVSAPLLFVFKCYSASQYNRGSSHIRRLNFSQTRYGF